MKAKIFNSQEVQAIIDGKKTMFREVIKPYPVLSDDKSYWEFKGVQWAGENSSYAKNFGDNARPEMPDLCPYQIGQKIKPKPKSGSIDLQLRLFGIELLIKKIRVERLADISEDDAIKEGATSRPHCHGYANIYNGWSMDWSKVGEASKWASNRKTLSESDVCMGSAQYAFGNFWNSTHKKLEEKWEANPWVWVVDFKINK